MQGGIFHLSVVNEYTRIIGGHNDQTRHYVRVVERQTFVLVRTEDHLLAVAEDDAALGAGLTVGNPVVCAVVEDNAVNQALNDRCTLMLLCLNEAVNGRRHIDIQRAGEERAAGTQYQFGGDERTLYRAKG